LPRIQSIVLKIIRIKSVFSSDFGVILSYFQKDVNKNDDSVTKRSFFHKLTFIRLIFHPLDGFFLLKSLVSRPEKCYDIMG